MPRTCSKCGCAARIRPFRLWNGRCSSCGAGVSVGAKIEDVNRPAPTSKEIIDFLRHMDDLNTIRKFSSLTMKFAFLLMFAHMLFGIGMASGFIHPRFGIIAWIMMAILFVTIGGKEFDSACPRCKKPFAYRKALGFRFPSRVADSCAHCGLRALSQDDIRQATEARPMWEDDDSTDRNSGQ